MKKQEVFRMGRMLKLSITGIVVEGLLSISSFLILYQILELIFGSGIHINELFILTFVVAGIFITRLILYSVSYVGSQIGGSDVSRNIRIALGDKMKRIPLNRFIKNKTGFYINGASSEVADYEQILTHKLSDIVKLSVLVMASGLAAACIYLPVGIVLIISSLLLIPTMYLTIRKVKFHGTKKNRARQENVSAITEYISGMQTLRAYGMGGRKNEVLTKAMKDYSDISYQFEKVVLPIGSIYMGISWLALPIIIMLTVNAYLPRAITPELLILLTMLPLYVAKSNGSLFILFLSYKNLMLSRENIERILGEEEGAADVTGFQPMDSGIEFEHVAFSYNRGEEVLKDVSFIIRQNSFTAIVGDSGSGKSTILNLIAKYYLPDCGRIRIGGCDTKGASSEQVLSNISAVDQNVFLFNDTVRNNIRYARADATDEEVEEACRLANCDGFIRDMKNGYDTQVGENGNRLSGGEKQRLSVARALIKNSPIILLDEATASLDIENELLVKQAISQLMKTDKTVIMVAHTLPIVRHADQILVVNDGRIVENGIHEELLEQHGKYAAMWKASQKLK